MSAYYNENDRQAAEWLRELIKAKLIPDGEVDQRSILYVQPEDIREFTQCHFFAGVGGWPYALRLAGWPDEKPVWTGSCPCQPFSNAGLREGEKDERHLWPVWRELISQSLPPAIFGEQVSSKAGKVWLSRVRADLEALGYGVGGADLCAAGLGAPHRRQRNFWVGYSKRERRRRQLESRRARKDWRTRSSRASGAGGLANADGSGRPARVSRETTANPEWSRFDLIPCRDGKARRVESGTFPLAHGVPGRVGLLRGYGNAIVPQQAAEFIKASEEALEAQ